jgi:hypothetical protein
MPAIQGGGGSFYIFGTHTLLPAHEKNAGDLDLGHEYIIIIIMYTSLFKRAGF